MNVYIPVKSLPLVFISALSGVGYYKKDISVEPSDKVSLFDAGGEGRRGFAILINMETGKTQMTQGSWGGSNIFNQHNSVDLDDRERALPPNGAVIKGSSGHGPVMAKIYLHPSNMAKFLPAPPSENILTPEQLAILKVYKEYKSGPYRQEELRRICSEENLATFIADLVKIGMLSQNKAGATALTTEGKNVVLMAKKNKLEDMP